MFRFSGHDVLWLTVVVALHMRVCGRKVETIRKGAKDAYQHAKRIEQAVREIDADDQVE